MAKDEERTVARILFVEQGTSRKDIAARLKVREKTVGEWATKGGWEDQRTAYLTNSQNVERARRGGLPPNSGLLTLRSQRGGTPRKRPGWWTPW